MANYRCVICGYTYDEDHEGVRWEDVHDGWQCPLCGATKDDFVRED